MRVSPGSTSMRTFVLWPIAVAAEQVWARRRLHPAWTPLLAVGFLTYRLSGSYRLPRAGGPPGLSQGRPERLVATGPYRFTRNPMYLGHLVFLAGLALVTRSPLATILALSHVPWFARRVGRDERRLEELFGPEYAAYRERVPRWLPWPRCTAWPTRGEGRGGPR